MKPLIFYLKETNADENKIILAKEEFEEMIEQAYQQGRSDGLSFISAPHISLTNPPNPLPSLSHPAIRCVDSSERDNPINIK